MGIRALASTVFKSFLKPASAGPGAFLESTVRPHEVNAWYGRPERREAAELVARFVGTVKVAVGRNAMQVASTPLRVYRKTTGKKSAFKAKRMNAKALHALRGRATFKALDNFDDVEEVTDPLFPLKALLENANPNDNGYSLLEGAVQYLGLCGNAYINMAGESGPPLELWPMAPQFTHAIPDPKTIIAAYIYGRGMEVERTFPADRVIHFRNPNPMGSPYYGRGDIEAVVEEADLSRGFAQFALATLLNGAQPGLVLSSENWTSETQVTQARLAFEAMYRGKFKAGQTMFLGGKVSVTPWNFGDKEMAFLASSERVDQAIANACDMPVSILRIDTAALATAKAAIPQWQLMAIKPRCMRIEQQLNQDLCPLFGEDVFVCFDQVVDQDIDATGLRVGTLYGQGVITKNEARRELGYDDVDGGDDFKAEAPNAGFGQGGGFGNQDGTDGNDPPAERDGSGSDGEGDDGAEGKSAARLIRAWEPDRGRDDERGERGAGEAVRATEAAAKGVHDLIWATGEHRCCTSPPRSARKDRRDAVLTASPRQLEAALLGWFQGLTPSIVDSVDESGMSIDLAQDPKVAESLARRVDPLLQALYMAGAAAGARDVADPGVLMEALTAGSRSFLDNYAGRLIRSVTDTLDRRIRDELAKGIGAGESVQQLQARISGLMGTAAPRAAELIARTESARAYLAAREEAWIQSGIVAGKEWLLAADPCEFCQAMATRYNAANLGVPFIQAGVTLAGELGGAMAMDYGAVGTPPLHPNCQCDMKAVFKEGYR